MYQKDLYLILTKSILLNRMIIEPGIFKQCGQKWAILMLKKTQIIWVSCNIMSWPVILFLILKFAETLPFFQCYNFDFIAFNNHFLLTNKEITYGDSGLLVQWCSVCCTANQTLATVIYLYYQIKWLIGSSCAHASKKPGTTAHVNHKYTSGTKLAVPLQ